MSKDVDKWIEIAKQCKYLPENDLKVFILSIYTSHLFNRPDDDEKHRPFYNRNSGWGKFYFRQPPIKM